MKEYTVKADVITGIKGAKYRKGDVVKENFFHVGHAKEMESKGFLELIGGVTKKKDKE